VEFSGSAFGSGGKYTAIRPGLKALQERTGATDAEVMQGIDSLLFGNPMPASLAADPEARSYLARVARLVHNVEPGRSPASLVTGAMTSDVITGNASPSRGVAAGITGRYNPMAPEDAGLHARGAGQAAGVPVPSRAKGGKATDLEAQALLAKEERLMVAYLSTLISQKKLVFADVAQLHDFIENKLRDYLAKEIGNKMTRVYQP
jgi:hypothetical protein